MEEIIIHPNTIRKFFKYKKDYANLLALYTFYMYHAKHQKTNMPLATDGFAKKGLGWALDRVKRIKKILKELKLIEVVRKGRFYYVKLPFIYSSDKSKEVIDRAKGKNVSKSNTNKKKQQKEITPFLKYYIQNGDEIPRERAEMINDIVQDLKDKKGYEIDEVALAKWLIHKDEIQEIFSRASLKHWMSMMHKKMSLEQRRMVERAIRFNEKDLTPETFGEYRELLGRDLIVSPYLIYFKLRDISITEYNEYVYYFENITTTSELDPISYFEKYEKLDIKPANI